MLFAATTYTLYRRSECAERDEYAMHLLESLHPVNMGIVNAENLLKSKTYAKIIAINNEVQEDEGLNHGPSCFR